jgi:hypothetical protein
LPRLVVEGQGRGGAEDALVDAANAAGADALDAAEPLEHLHVLVEGADVEFQFVADFGRARLPLVEHGEDVLAHRVADGMDQATVHEPLQPVPANFLDARVPDRHGAPPPCESRSAAVASR